MIKDSNPVPPVPNESLLVSPYSNIKLICRYIIRRGRSGLKHIQQRKIAETLKANTKTETTVLINYRNTIVRSCGVGAWGAGSPTKALNRQKLGQRNFEVFQKY